MAFNIVPLSLCAQIALRSLNLRSYSVFNAVLFWFSALVHKPFLPIAVCSVVATCSSFYSVLFVNAAAINDMRIKYGYTMPVFLIGDFVLHALPLLFTYFKYWQQAVDVIAEARDSVQIPCGLTSLLIHVLWLHMNNDMNATYAYLSDMSWLVLWNVALFGHVATMNALHTSARLGHR